MVNLHPHANTHGSLLLLTPSVGALRWAIGLFMYQTFDAVDGTQAYVTNRLGALSRKLISW